MCGSDSNTSMEQGYVSNPATGATSLNNYGVGWNGAQMGVQNPGSIDISQTNPALSGDIDAMKSLGVNANQMVDNAFDPHYFDQLKGVMKSNQETSTNNQFARMGLAGSSAAAGAVTQGDTNIDLSMLQRQQGMQMQALNAAGGVDKSIAGMQLQGQGQYNQFQQSGLDAYFGLVNAQNQAQASNNAMWGAMIGGAASGAGMAAGGL